MEENKNEQKLRLFPILFFPTLFILVIWMVKITETVLEINFIKYGIYPRKAEGLIGILFYPLIHGDYNHLINNSIPLLILGVGIFYFYKSIAYKIYFWTYIMTGIWIWAPNPQGLLRVGMFVDVFLETKVAKQAVVIPREAVVLENGLPVAFVLLDGETFQKRNLQLGIRDGDFVEVIAGIAEGERVVTRGAFFVRLALASPASFGEGHAH